MLRPFLVLSLAFCALRMQAQDLAGDLTLHRLLIEGEIWQPVAEGIGFADGPCTDAEGNFYYSDLKGNAVFKIALDGTKTTVIEEPASGLKFGPDVGKHPPSSNSRNGRRLLRIQSVDATH